MEKALIIVNADAWTTGQVSKLSPVTERMVNALKNAIPSSHAVEVIGTASLWSGAETPKAARKNTIYCPLTIQLPCWLDFPAKSVFHACRNIEERRAWVADSLHYKICRGESSFGDLWLPIAVTDRGIRYGDIIGEGMIPNSYTQPQPIGEKNFRSLTTLAERLLEDLNAPPSVYLLQFRSLDREIIFDRLWPFPAAPAIASLHTKQSNLYTSYWQCLQGSARLNLSLVAGV
jgi:hypothetical protein